MVDILVSVNATCLHLPATTAKLQVMHALTHKLFVYNAYQHTSHFTDGGRLTCLCACCFFPSPCNSGQASGHACSHRQVARTYQHDIPQLEDRLLSVKPVCLRPQQHSHGQVAGEQCFTKVCNVSQYAAHDSIVPLITRQTHFCECHLFPYPSSGG